MPRKLKFHNPFIRRVFSTLYYLRNVGDNRPVSRSLVAWLLVVLLGFAAPAIHAGGSGLNVVVVVNQHSPNSVELGNYYRERRNVPPQNVLRIIWTGPVTEWTLADYNRVLLNPLLTMLSARHLTNQIDYVVLSMDIPYRVNGAPNGKNSTTSTLFYGFMPDPRDLANCPLAPNSTSLYAGSEGVFRSTPPIAGRSNCFLATMITATNLALAKQVVDQGSRSDGTFPTQPVMLAKSSDAARNIRYQFADNAVFEARLRGNYSIMRTNVSTPSFFTNILGYQNGSYGFGIERNEFVPGAMADNLTSFGGTLFDNAGQTTLLTFLEGGASGSYGTVDEPCTYPQKFPSPLIYFYQARGFSLAECYYQSLLNPYQGLVVGEPLAAPFAQTASGSWVGLPANALLAGTTNLSLQFTAADAQHPLQQVDLFLDGTWLQTLTNIPPTPGDVLYILVNGHGGRYTIKPHADLSFTATDLAQALDSQAFASLSKVQAVPHGDRIELQSTDPSLAGAQIPISVGSSNAMATPITFFYASRATFLDSVAWGIKPLRLNGLPDTNSWLKLVITKTNGHDVTLAFTNSANGNTLQFTQKFLDAVNADAGLQGDDGVAGEDPISENPAEAVQFHLRARSPGLAAAQIRATLTSSLHVTTVGPPTFTANLSDLLPRNHLYIGAGVTNLSLTFPLDTTALADGYHELAAVAYEGSHVRTQTHVVQNVGIQNHSLSATLACADAETDTSVAATLHFTITANTPHIRKIELFGTGGSLGAVSGKTSASFPVSADSLGPGLHPFYAVVTDSEGHEYRTESKYIRIGG